MTCHFAIRVSVGAVAVQIALAWIFAIPLREAQADYKDDTGYNQLQTELGGSMPDGTGVGVSQVEADEDPNAPVEYMPNASDSQFSGKTITDRSGVTSPPGATSNHATIVGRYFYGNSSSFAPGILNVDAWQADDWLTGTSPGFLMGGTNSAPNVESQDVQNHSWISDSSNATSHTNRLRRLDYAINRDGFTSVVGQNNGNTTTLPELLGQSYNAISVGRSDGNHSHGFTTIDGTGRIKPEIVAPRSATSYATPLVGGAAALIIEKAAGTGGLGDATNPEAVKAILMAGATKDEFGTWDRTTTRPLDDRYGVGELNVYRSYHILVDNGEQPASDSSTVTTLGWDFNTTVAGSNYYFFDVPSGETMNELSALLTWNRVVDDGPWTGVGPDSTLTNIDLYLHAATGFTPGTLLDSSVSEVDNVEHIYRTDGLAAGRYVLEVDSPIADVEYSLAWHSTIVPEPSSILLTGIGLFAFLAHYLRRRHAPMRA